MIGTRAFRSSLDVYYLPRAISIQAKARIVALSSAHARRSRSLYPRPIHSLGLARVYLHRAYKTRKVVVGRSLTM